MRNKLTKEPWKIMHKLKGNRLVGNGTYGFIEVSLTCGDEMDDVARLISAAPELLEACKDAIGLLWTKPSTASKILEQVISKAEGEQ